MKRLLISLVIAALPAIGADALAGEYAARIQEMASGLMLRADNTFEYYLTYGAADYSAKGSWRRDNDAVVLTSSGPAVQPIRVLRTAKGTTGTTRIFVVGTNGQGAQHIDVLVKTADGELEGRTSREGLASFEVKGSPKSVSIHIPVYDIEAGPFAIADGTNDVWLEINVEAVTQLRFQDERLRLVNGALEMTYWKGSKPLLYNKKR